MNIYYFIYLYKKFIINKNQTIMTTISTILFVTAMTFVFTGFAKLIKFIK